MKTPLSGPEREEEQWGSDRTFLWGPAGKGGPCVSSSRELDRHAVRDLERALQATWDQPTDQLVFDLSGLSSLDRTGLAALLRARRQAREGDVAMTVVRPRGPASRVFTLTRVGEILKTAGAQRA